MEGNIDIRIDYEKFAQDQQWDELKGYITNSRLGAKNVIENYRHLFHIERTFRISKSDLRIRPVDISVILCHLFRACCATANRCNFLTKFTH